MPLISLVAMRIKWYNIERVLSRMPSTQEVLNNYSLRLLLLYLLLTAVDSVVAPPKFIY